MYLELFPIALRTVLKVPVFTILLRHSHTLNSWTAVSNYYGFTKVNRVDILQKEKSPLLLVDIENMFIITQTSLTHHDSHGHL